VPKQVMDAVHTELFFKCEREYVRGIFDEPENR